MTIPYIPAGEDPIGEMCREATRDINIKFSVAKAMARTWNLPIWEDNNG